MLRIGTSNHPRNHPKTACEAKIEVSCGALRSLGSKDELGFDPPEEAIDVWQGSKDFCCKGENSLGIFRNLRSYPKVGVFWGHCSCFDPLFFGSMQVAGFATHSSPVKIGENGATR